MKAIHDIYTPAVCYLRMATWVDSSVAYAEHYYGRLACGDNRKTDVEVKHPLSAAEAERLNDTDGYTMHPYKAGELSARFFSREQLVTAAKACYRECFPSAILLIDGDSCVYDPQEVLDGPPDLVSRMNRIWQECEKLDFWEIAGNSERVNELFAEWHYLWLEHLQARAPAAEPD